MDRLDSSSLSSFLPDTAKLALGLMFGPLFIDKIMVKANILDLMVCKAAVENRWKVGLGGEGVVSSSPAIHVGLTTSPGSPCQSGSSLS